jgi:hypothetical protein
VQSRLDFASCRLRSASVVSSPAGRMASTRPVSTDSFLGKGSELPWGGAELRWQWWPWWLGAPAEPIILQQNKSIHF